MEVATKEYWANLAEKEKEWKQVNNKKV